ncbi:HTH-type transcriptional repressor Bm3R1 [Corynebacterium glaucum]|nr:HTH-type transcriptional repressor Bm3R1 [Corynebacterium glaucum]
MYLHRKEQTLPALNDLTPAQPPETTPGGQRILDAASELFYARGIGATGLDLVVEQSGVTKRTLYQRFGSKEGLICAYLTARAHRWQTLVLQRVQVAIDSGEDPVSAVFDLTREWIADNPRGCGFVNAWAELGGNSGAEIQTAIRQEKQWMRTLFFTTTGDEQVGELIHELYEGALICSTILGDQNALQRAKAGAQRLVGG